MNKEKYKEKYNKITNIIFTDTYKEVYYGYFISMFLFIMASPFSTIHSFVVLTVLFFYPVWAASVKKIDYFDFGLNNIDWKKTFLHLTIWSLITFIPYILFVIYYQGNSNLTSFIKHFSLPKKYLVETLLYQILVVGLSEEFFYRGYLQPLIQKKYNRVIIKFLDLDTGVILLSLLFAIGHIFTYYTIFSLLTFFPSLVFGILRNKTDSIIASMIYHGFSNSIMVLIIHNIGNPF